MRLSQLIAEIGDDNVQFQSLDNDLIRLNTKRTGQSEVTFGTEAQITPNGTEKLGLVLWLDREQVKKATESEQKERQEDA